MTPDDHEAAEDPSRPAVGERSPKTVPVGVFVLAVVVAGILGVLAVVALMVSNEDVASDGQSGARAAAGDYAERFLALSYDDYDGWLQDMETIGTAGFAESIERREDELRTLMTQAQVTWQGTAVDVFATDGTDGIVSAVVLYDLTVTDPSGTRTIPDQYLRVDLVEGRDGWLVERVLSITSDASAVVAGATPPPPSSPPPTTSAEPG